MRGDRRHRDVDPIGLGRAAVKRVIAGVVVAEPRPRDEIRGELLVGVEVAIEREEDECVLLRAHPAARLARREQPGDELRDQVRAQRLLDQRLEHDGVRPRIRREQQVALVAVARGEARRAGRLADVIHQELDQRLALRRRARITRDRAEHPAGGLDRELVTGDPEQQLGLRDVEIPEQLARVERERFDREPLVVAVIQRDVAVDRAQIPERVREQLARHREALRLRAREGVRDVDAQVRHLVLVALPEAEAAVVALHLREVLEVDGDALLHRRRGRQILRVERAEHVAQPGDREDPARALLRALEWIVNDVEQRIGQRLEIGRRGADLEPAELRDDSGGRCDRLLDRPVRTTIDRAVGRECFGRRRGPHRQRQLGGVACITGRADDLDPRRPRELRRGRELDERAIVRRHRHAATRTGGEREVGRADRQLHRHRCIGLVLDHDR